MARRALFLDRYTPYGYTKDGSLEELMKKANTKSSHPDHSIHKKRLNRVRGQLDGIERMIDDKRYCPEIIIQIRAASKALEAIEMQIMTTHVHGCLNAAIEARDKNEVINKIDEIMALVKR